MLCVKFGLNWPSGSGEEDENVKSLQTDGRTDGRTDVTFTLVFSLHSSIKRAISGKYTTVANIYNHMPLFNVFISTVDV